MVTKNSNPKVATKSTKQTTNNAASKRLQSVLPVGTTIASRPLFPNEGEPNDVRVKAPKITENMKLKTSTVTSPENDDACDYDDMPRASGSDRPYPVQFERIDDGQSDRKADGIAIIPEWSNTGDANIQDPYAVNRSTMDIGSYRGTVQDKATLPVPSYHKSPSVKTFNEQDNASVSMMSTGQVSIHSPISAGYMAG
jgi:hypothetical protein